MPKSLKPRRTQLRARGRGLGKSAQKLPVGARFTPTFPRSHSNHESTVLVASDWAPIRAFDSIIKSDPETVYGDMLPVLRAADLRIVNCECVFTSLDKPVWKSGAVFKGEPDHVRGLVAVPFEVACLANNHVFDFGVQGFQESLKVLHGQGIKTVGAGLTEEQAHQPLDLEWNKNRITIINISEGEDLTASKDGPGVYGWDLERARSQIRRSKRRGRCVFVIAHCGLEYIPFPPAYIVAAFRSLADAGADCVIGHHPHVPQGIERYRGKPIAYSLGNFVFYQLTDLYYRKIGFCLRVRVDGTAVVGIDLHPYRITESGLMRLGAREEKQFHRQIARISRPFLAPAGPGAAWQAYLAYYGLHGFAAEVSAILERMRAEPEKGAAMFRNRITTLQHSELWRDFLTRIMSGNKPRYSREAYGVVQEWFTKEA
jgi:poly-gamma-glutamate capsule biosynthesis protein CapA/YwtB (metallophosphatase superfamily)